jgi:nicotinamidase-related amidase
MNKVLYVVLGFFFAIVTNSFAQSELNLLKNKIVIVVHIQEPDAEGKFSKEHTEDAIKKINQVIEEADPENVIYVKSVVKALNVSFKKICVEELDTPLDSRLKIINQNIFTDNGGDVFESEELYEFIKEKNIDQIVIVGRVAEGCITKTAIGGEKLGFQMFIVPDAIIGGSEESKNKALSKLEKKGVEILSI